MTYYDYKVVPAPKRAKRVKGVHGAEDLFALTLTEAINEVARQGWEFVRAEHMPSEAPRGWLRAPATEEQTVLLFRRARESAGPRLVAATRPEVVASSDPETSEATSPAERAVIDRLQHKMRREPALRLDPLPETATDATPLRPAPRLGPADKS